MPHCASETVANWDGDRGKTTVIQTTKQPSRIRLRQGKNAGVARDKSRLKCLHTKSIIIFLQHNKNKQKISRRFYLAVCVASNGSSMNLHSAFMSHLYRRSDNCPVSLSALVRQHLFCPSFCMWECVSPCLHVMYERIHFFNSMVAIQWTTAQKRVWMKREKKHSISFSLILWDDFNFESISTR